MSCLKFGPAAAARRTPSRSRRCSPRDDDKGVPGGLRLQAMAPRRGVAEALAGAPARADARAQRLPRQGARRSAASTRSGPAPVSVRALPAVPRERIVLPEPALARIERHTAGLARHRDSAARERPPRAPRAAAPRPARHRQDAVGDVPRRADAGAHRDPAHRAGRSAPIGAACGLARSLEPAMVVIEDVDLIAQDRASLRVGAAAVRAAQRDGRPRRGRRPDLRADDEPAPRSLEAALASRPGRIDLAVELPLPDAPARRRLFELYGAGLALGVPDWEPIVAATDGTSPAFIRRAVPPCRPGRGRGRARGGRGARTCSPP